MDGCHHRTNVTCHSVPELSQIHGRPAASAAARRSRLNRSRWISAAFVAVMAVCAAVVFLWDWNWFKPIVEARLSAYAGRSVSMERLRVQLGRVTTIIAEDVRIASPAGFHQSDLATASSVAVEFSAETWIRSGRIVLPTIVVEQPVFTVLETATEENNWTLALPQAETDGPAIEVGTVSIRNGTGRARLVPSGSDVEFAIATASDGGRQTLIVDAKGTYAGQPITAHAIGDALLSLRNADIPYSVDFSLANGATRIALKGTIQNPLVLTGANLDLMLSGQDMALLYPLTGIPIPKTPPYRVSGKLDFEGGRIRFTHMQGKVGSSDLNGALAIDPRGTRPILSGILASRSVDLEDLGGFIGSQPGRTTTPGQTPEQVRQVQRAEDHPRLLPTTPISIPKIQSMDIHITYKGDKIVGRNVPFDSIAAKLDIDNGRITLSPLRLDLGGGSVTGMIKLNPVGEELDTDAAVKIQRVDVGKLLAVSGLGSGRGTISGTATIKGRGRSMSEILGRGDGAADIVMPLGGEVNSLLATLSGGELGRAFLAAIGIPDKESIRCLVADMVLMRGVVASRTLVVNTSDHLITGGGRADLFREVLDMHLRTDSKHFTIGTLATPLRIYGPFKDLHFATAPELVLRGGAAIGLGLLFPPAAVLPTIQFGVGEGSPCQEKRR